jgi:hypothetical protein
MRKPIVVFQLILLIVLSIVWLPMVKADIPSVTGKWTTFSGVGELVMFLTQHGSGKNVSVTGSYGKFEKVQSGRIQGTLNTENGYFSGTFARAGRRGEVRWTFTANTFSGEWKYKSRNKWKTNWTGKRFDETPLSYNSDANNQASGNRENGNLNADTHGQPASENSTSDVSSAPVASDADENYGSISQNTPHPLLEITGLIVPQTGGEKKIQVTANVQNKSRSNKVPRIIMSLTKAFHLNHKRPIQNGKIEKKSVDTFANTVELNVRRKGEQRQNRAIDVHAGSQIYMKVTAILDQHIVTRHFVFTIPDDPLTLAIAGDSFAAGHGTNHYDLNEAKKRSSLSGFELAVAALKTKYHINYINVSTSGNKLTPDLLKKSSDTAGAQTRDILKWLAEEDEAELNYLLMSAGGNDAYIDGDKQGLSVAVKDILLAPETVNYPTEARLLKGTDHVRNSWKTISANLKKGLDGYKANIARWNRFLDATPQLKNTHIVHTTYGDMTKNDNGQYKRVRRMSKNKLRFSYEEIISPLNQIIKNNWNRNTKRYAKVDIEARSRHHGYAAKDNWFVRYWLQDTRLNSDTTDAFHPNKKGFEKMYRDPVKNAVDKHFQANKRTLVVPSLEDKLKSAVN